MEVTTIIPTYNRHKLLLRAVDSAINQTHGDVKVIIRDNASTDQTDEVVVKNYNYDRRVVYQRLSRNIGAHENIRQGIRSVETEFFSFLCDDDYLNPEFYAEGLRLFEQYPEAGFIVFSVDAVDINGDVKFSNFKSKDEIEWPMYFTSAEGISAYCRGDIPYTLTGYLFRKEVAREIDFFEFSEVGYGADIFFIWHAACRFNFVVTNVKGGCYTIHENTTSNTLVKAFDERFLYWWRNRILLILRDDKIESAAREVLESFYFRNTINRYSDKSYYLMAAFSLVSKRLVAKEENDLRFDFIAMRSFLPTYMLFLVKYIYLPLDKMGFIARLRDLMLSYRDGLRKLLSS